MRYLPLCVYESILGLKGGTEVLEYTAKGQWFTHSIPQEYQEIVNAKSSAVVQSMTDSGVYIVGGLGQKRECWYLSRTQESMGEYESRFPLEDKGQKKAERDTNKELQVQACHRLSSKACQEV